ncbi:TPA: cytochrome c, partial [Klebsiella pneumoniae]
HYGNPEVTVSAGDVAWVRQGGHPPLLARAQPWIMPGIVALIVILLAVCAGLTWRRRRRIARDNG